MSLLQPSACLSFFRLFLRTTHRLKVCLCYAFNYVLPTLILHIDIGGRIYREGKTSRASRIQLGTVAAIASGELPHQLRMDGLDKINLYPNNDGDYECELFWDGMPAPVRSEDNVRIFHLL
jgi:hypothetical protein